MRYLLILFPIIALHISCNQTNPNKVTNESANEKKYIDTAGIKYDRQIIIEGIKQLQSAFATNKKEIIADFFSFPLDNESLGIYITDSSYTAQYEKNDNKMTRAMFVNYYREISKSLQFEQINMLFKYIRINNLLNKNSVEHEEIIKAEPCYHFYGVKIENELVTLTLGKKSNKYYKSKNDSPDEIPKNSSEFCEHILWWVLVFDGTQLHVKSISGAG